MKKKTFLKIIPKILLTLTFYYFFVFLLLPNFVDPKISNFENYHRILNWDQRQHAQGDFDNDGQEDFITFTGCAFLSSINEDTIPEPKKCTAQGIFNSENIKYGQKYIESNEEDLNLGNINKQIRHSYISKKQNQNWKIFVSDNEGIKIFEIKNGEALKQDSINLTYYKIDEFMYDVSSLFFLLSIPLIPISFIFSLVLNNFGLSENLFHIIGSLFLLSITFTSHHLFNKK